MIDYQSWRVIHSERIGVKIARFKPAYPLIDFGQYKRHIEALEDGGIFGQIAAGQGKQSPGGLKPVLLQMDKCAGKLDESLVKPVIGRIAPSQPKLFENVVRFIEELAVEALEIAKVMRVVRLSAAAFNQRRYFCRFFAQQ